MAEVTVTELAKTVGASVDRLLMQMKEAGLSHDSAEATVSDDEKQTLLGYADGPKKITLRRKTTSTLKVAGAAGKRTVNVEVRKKRTYIKRSDEEILAQTDIELEVKAREAAEAEAAAAQAAVEEPTVKKGSGTDDVEEKRLAAIANRRKIESDALVAVEQAAKGKLDDEARKATEAASALESDEAKKAGKTTKHVATPASEPVQDKARRHGKSIDDDEDKLAKKAKKPLGKPGKKKGRLQLDDGGDDKKRGSRLSVKRLRWIISTPLSDRLRRKPLRLLYLKS